MHARERRGEQHLRSSTDRVKPRRLIKFQRPAPERTLYRTETTMTTPRLPPELLDHIADLLHDSKTTLRNCCLVSKSWVPRTRRHLFAEVRFDDTGGELGSWKGTFPDPSTSPAHYTKTLFFDSLQYATAADADWIKGFSSVVRFQWVGNRNPFADRSHITLVPFHGFSPVIISLSIHLAILPFSRLFNLILSFPLLEDLTAITCHDTLINIDNGSSTVVQPSNIPVFIGSLHISNHLQGIKSTAQWLLSLPGDISFRKLNLIWHKVEDIRLTMALVERCSHTLESLDITCVTSGASILRLRRHRGFISVSSGVNVISS